MGWCSGKETACQCKRCGFDPWVRKFHWSRKQQLTPIFLPGKFYGQRSLESHSPWGHKVLEMTKHKVLNLSLKLCLHPRRKHSLYDHLKLTNYIEGIHSFNYDLCIHCRQADDRQIDGQMIGRQIDNRKYVLINNYVPGTKAMLQS